MAKRLTDLAVERLSIPAKGDRIVYDSGAIGLLIKVTPGGKRVWCLWLRYPGQKHQSARVLGYSLAGSVLFFIVTNFGVWASGTMYPKTGAGLVAAYVAGIPFFQWTVLGTLFYAALLFGGFELLRRRVPALQAQTV